MSRLLWYRSCRSNFSLICCDPLTSQPLLLPHNALRLAAHRRRC